MDTGVVGTDGLADTFDRVALRYERARPAYPAALFDDLVTMAGLPGPAVRVLEVGPGTGQATRGLLRRGWSVVAVEPGRELAAVATRVLAGLGDLQVCVAPFETWQEPPGERFDLVFAATAWHWLDPAVAYRKAAGLLRPGGSLAVVTTSHVLPEQGGDRFFRDVEEVYDAVGLGDGLGGPRPPEAVTVPETAAIAASGCFHSPLTSRYVWWRDYPVDEYLDLLGTYSNHIAASDEQRATLFAELSRRVLARPGGTVRKHYLNVLHVASPVAAHG